MYERDGSRISKIIKEPHSILEENEHITKESTFIKEEEPIISRGDSEIIHERIKMKLIDQEAPHEDITKENEMLKNQLQNHTIPYYPTHHPCSLNIL